MSTRDHDVNDTGTWRTQVEHPLYCLSEEFEEHDCDAISYCASFLLHQEQVHHKLISGCVVDNKTGDYVSPHVWIETQDGHIVDFRLQKWLGESNSVPHGIFLASGFDRFTYTGTSFEIDVSLEELASDLTDERISEFLYG